VEVVQPVVNFWIPVWFLLDNKVKGIANTRLVAGPSVGLLVGGWVFVACRFNKS